MNQNNYFSINYNINQFSDERGKGVHLKIKITRIIMNELLTTYLPTALLMIIVYATTFFKPNFFEAALSVNLSVMFVMSTLFVSVMEKLPQTSYVRMVDVWLIFGQLIPFIEVVLITYMESCRGPCNNKNVLNVKTASENIDERTIQYEVPKSGKVLVNIYSF